MTPTAKALPTGGALAPSLAGPAIEPRIAVRASANKKPPPTRPIATAVAAIRISTAAPVNPITAQRTSPTRASVCFDQAGKKPPATPRPAPPRPGTVRQPKHGAGDQNLDEVGHAALRGGLDEGGIRSWEFGTEDEASGVEESAHDDCALLQTRRLTPLVVHSSQLLAPRFYFFVKTLNFEPFFGPFVTDLPIARTFA